MNRIGVGALRNLEFWLRASDEYWWGKKYWEIYEWTIELLLECRLMRLGVGVSIDTKGGRKGWRKEEGSVPVKGLDGLRGM